MKTGIVGCGKRAHAHAEAALASGRIDLVACADIVVDQAHAFAAQYAIPRAYADMETMLREERLDLVILVTWPEQHLEQIRLACDLHVPAILCEKSLALSGEEGDEILRLVRASGTFLMEGLMYRHHPQIQKAKELVGEGAIGELGYIHAHFSAPVNLASGASNWRNRPGAGGSMAAKGCYLVDALTFFADSAPVEVFARATSTPEGVEVAQTATMVFANGVTGHFESSHRVAWREHITLSGTKGTLIIPHAIVTKTQPRHIELHRGGIFENRPMAIERFDFPVQDSTQLQL
ncbi:MAG TPA: Gfo/Idh/MocA family oxidoreductase, partial [Chloroflexota bacterium]|nr:Gfo/Idh/MocA family oxidoreductase [Chloroflexota bacterium]